MATKKTNWMCKALMKKGKPCRAAATAGGLCFFHANPNKATELGPLGGRSHHRPADGNADSLPTLDCATVQDKIDRLMAGVLTGKIPPRVAAALTTLLALKLRVIEATKFEVRTEKLQKFADEVVDNLDCDDSPPLPDPNDRTPLRDPNVPRAWGSYPTRLIRYG